MKKFLIGLVLDSVFNALIGALQKAAMRSSSDVDDKLVQVIANEQDEIKAEIMRKL